MAEIDTLLLKISEMNADCADLRADEQVEVVTAGVIKKGAHVPAELLKEFLLEIIPSNRKRELNRQRPFEFVYSSPYGYFEVAVSWSADRLQAVIEPTDPPVDEMPADAFNDLDAELALPAETIVQLPEVEEELAETIVAPRGRVNMLSVLVALSVVVMLGIGCMFYLQQ